VRGGYLTIGRWRGAPVRAHWSLPIGALVFGRGQFVPGFWLGFVLLVLIHEIGHAVLVKRYRHRLSSIDVHGFGGVCCWSGDPTAIERASIAWGGVLAQAVALAFAWAALRFAGPPDTVFVAELASAFTATNLWLIAINLIPVAPLDGAEAWKLPGLLAARRRKRGGAGFAYEREAATLQRYADEPSNDVKVAVDDALRRIAGDTKKPQN
jgi:Zn-dependent protease